MHKSILRSFAAIFAAVALFAPHAVSAQTEDRTPIQVMVVGVYHFDNPGQDLHNARADPVTTPEKQAQLQALTERLAQFRPTVVAVERVATDPQTLIDPHYASFEPGDLLTNADERVQIGYRLAAMTGLEQVHAVDEQSDVRDYFPFGAVQAWLQANGRLEAFERMNAPVAEAVADLERRQASETIGDVLAYMNGPDSPLSGDAGQAVYYGMLSFGDGVEQPGAALNAGWYERNARIFTKLISATEPGDRVVLVIGGGHSYWLNHFIETTPGFELIDPVPYLAEP